VFIFSSLDVTEQKVEAAGIPTSEFFTPRAYYQHGDYCTWTVVLVLVAFSIHVVTCSTTPGNQTDRQSLLEFKKAISLDLQQALVSWNDSTHFCNWEGVMCRTRSRRVTNLDLANPRFSQANIRFTWKPDISVCSF